MRTLITIVLLLALTYCKDFTEEEKNIKPISITKEFEINGAKDTSIYKIGDIAFLDSLGFVVTDVIDYKIKLFNKSGILQSSFGGIDNNTNSFKNPPYILAYDNPTKRLAVYEYSSDSLKCFDQKLKMTDQLKLKLKAPIIGLQFDNKSNLITVLPMAVGGNRFVNFWNRKGDNISSFNLKDMDNHSMLNMFDFNYNKYLNKIVITYLYKNLVRIYSTEGKMEKEFSIPFYPEQSETKENKLKTSFGTIQREVPIHRMFQDAATDNAGRIFLLAGFYSKDGEKKRIYVVDNNGKILSKIELAAKASSIFIDNDDCLFAISENRNVITKYRINEK